jgi:hypothetical protein
MILKFKTNVKRIAKAACQIEITKSIWHVLYR